MLSPLSTVVHIYGCTTEKKEVRIYVAKLYKFLQDKRSQIDATDTLGFFCCLSTVY